MGKITFKTASPYSLIEEFGYLETYLHSSSRVTLLDGDGGEITLRGKDLVFDENKDMVSGTITSVTLGNDDGAVFVQYSGKIKADSILQEGGIEWITLLRRLFADDDQVIGSKDDDFLFGSTGKDKIDGGDGNDAIYGDTGNDRMTGGKGYDTFGVGTYRNRDTITDFDATPDNNGFQDRLFRYSNEGWEAIKKGKDTLIDFENGDSVLLLGVKPSQIDDTDFI